MSDYGEIFGREPERWREPLGALLLTLTGDPEKVDVERAQEEVEELVKVLKQRPPAAHGAEESGWEYRVEWSVLERPTSTSQIFDTYCRAHDFLLANIHGGTIFRRRKAGPWEVVEREGAQ